MDILFWLILLGVISGTIAKFKGYSFFAWWIYGVLLAIVAIPHAILIKPSPTAIAERKGDTRKCPFCAEMVKPEAVVCKHCGKDLPPYEPSNTPSS
jgi:hypothetical protein